jgi:hypothetical protein
MTPLFEHYSQLEKVPESQVLLTLNDVQVHPNDTPDSLKLTVASVLGKNKYIPYSQNYT